MIFDKNMLLLYAVTDRGYCLGKSLYEQVEQALSGGVTLVQLREKYLSDDEFTQEAKLLKKLCHSYGVPLIINDRADIAISCGADGVHVGADDESVCEIRKKAPDGFIIGATAKTEEQAQRAERDGADYIGVGAVFVSSTKKNAIRITEKQLKQITSSVSIPAVAIGGITNDKALSLKGSGVCGIAVVSALFSADDITGAAIKLKKTAVELTKEI